MRWVIRNRKFFINDSGNHWTCPDARCESICHRAAVQYVCKFSLLVIGQRRRTSRAMPLQHTVHSLLLPVSQPNGDFGTVNLESVANLGSCFALHAEYHGVESTGNSICSFSNGLFAKCNQLLYLFGRSMDFDHFH